MSEFDEQLKSVARALTRGDPLTAISLTAGRDEAAAMAMRAVALAQLGEYQPALKLLTSARQKFLAMGNGLGAARTRAASAEILAAKRELGAARTELAIAAAELAGASDFANAAWAKLVQSRLLTLSGNSPEASAALEAAGLFAEQGGTVLVRAAIQVAVAEAASRRMEAKVAEQALGRAAELMNQAPNQILSAEITRLRRAISEVTIALLHRGSELEELTALDLESALTALPPDVTVIDGLRFRVTFALHDEIDLSQRPVLFSLLEALGRALPFPAERNALIEAAFSPAEIDESDRARLRVELGRLRRVLEPGADIVAGAGGWTLAPRDEGSVVTLVPTAHHVASVIEALLSDGEAWTASALAGAAKKGKRTVQRSLKELVETGRVTSTHQGKKHYYRAVERPPAFASQMLLLGLTSTR